MTREEIEADINKWHAQGRPFSTFKLSEIEHLKESNQDLWILKVFVNATPGWRKSMREQYEKHIAVADGTYDPGVYPITHHLRGKPRPMPEPLPKSLIAVFRKALATLNEVIELCGDNNP